MDMGPRPIVERHIYLIVGRQAGRQDSRHAGCIAGRQAQLVCLALKIHVHVILLKYGQGPQTYSRKTHLLDSWQAGRLDSRQADTTSLPSAADTCTCYNTQVWTWAPDL